MPQNKVTGKAYRNAFTLIWSPEMMLTFLRVLEKHDNLGKSSNTRWKPKAWNECQDTVQQVYTSTSQINIDKLKSKLEYV